MLIAVSRVLSDGFKGVLMAVSHAPSDCFKGVRGGLPRRATMAMAARAGLVPATRVPRDRRTAATPKLVVASNVPSGSGEGEAHGGLICAKRRR